VLMVATIGFNSQMAANFLAAAPSIDLARTRSSSQPATKSAAAKSTLPELNKAASTS
jgi:L-cystine uptake protein TcyP (sodium:dicarboxylate symporter family)